MPLDPFAPSNDYDPVKLPAVPVLPRMDMTFADHWLAVEAAHGRLLLDPDDFLAAQALGAYEPGKRAFLDFNRLLHDTTEIRGGWQELAAATVPIDPNDPEKLERRARLSVAIRVQAGKDDWPRVHVVRALVHALEVGPKLQKRDEAKRIAEVEGRHLAEGKGATAAVKSTAAEIGVAEGRIWGLHKSPEYIVRRDFMQRSLAAHGKRFIAFLNQHAADVWFIGDTIEEQGAAADRVASHITARMREGIDCKSRKGKRPISPPNGLKWDALLMVEGFVKRRLPLSNTVCIMLDHAMGLLDADGHPIASKFGGIRKREEFMATAESEANGWDTDEHVYLHDLRTEMEQHGKATVGPKQLRAWRKREHFKAAVALRRNADSQQD